MSDSPLEACDQVLSPCHQLMLCAVLLYQTRRSTSVHALTSQCAVADLPTAAFSIEGYDRRRWDSLFPAVMCLARLGVQSPPGETESNALVQSWWAKTEVHWCLQQTRVARMRYVLIAIPARMRNCIPMAIPKEQCDSLTGYLYSVCSLASVAEANARSLGSAKTA